MHSVYRDPPNQPQTSLMLYGLGGVPQGQDWEFNTHCFFEKKKLLPIQLKYWAINIELSSDASMKEICFPSQKNSCFGQIKNNYVYVYSIQNHGEIRGSKIHLKPAMPGTGNRRKCRLHQSMWIFRCVGIAILLTLPMVLLSLGIRCHTLMKPRMDGENILTKWIVVDWEGCCGFGVPPNKFYVTCETFNGYTRVAVPSKQWWHDTHPIHNPPWSVDRYMRPEMTFRAHVMDTKLERFKSMNAASPPSQSVLRRKCEAHP